MAQSNILFIGMGVYKKTIVSLLENDDAEGSFG